MSSFSEQDLRKSPGISPCYCVNLRRAANRITEQYNEALAPVGITVTQYSILAFLYGMSGCSVSQLAQKLHLEKSTLVRNLQPLFEKNYIEDLSTEKSRSKELQITVLGNQLLFQAKPLWKKSQKNLQQKMGGKNIDLLMELIQQLGE